MVMNRSAWKVDRANWQSERDLVMQRSARLGFVSHSASCSSDAI